MSTPRTFGEQVARFANLAGLGVLLLAGLAIVVLSLPPLSAWYAPPVLVGALIALALAGHSFIDRGLGEAWWFTLIIAALIAALPTTEFAILNDIGGWVNWGVGAGLVLLVVLFSLEGPRQAGIWFVVVALALVAFLGYLVAYDFALNRIEAVHEQADLTAERQQAYDEAKAAIDQRLEEIGAVGQAGMNGVSLEERLDFPGLPQAEVERLKKALVIIRQYEASEKLRKAQEGPAWKQDREKTERVVEEEKDEKDEAEMTQAEKEAKAAAEQFADVGDDVSEEVAEEVDERVLVTPAEAALATALAHVSMFFTRLVAIVAVFLAAFQYLRQLNWTFPVINALPLTGRWLDRFQPKEHSVHLQTDDPDAVAFFLCTAVRKGEAFLCIGDTIDLPAHLPRWVFGPLALPIDRLAVLDDSDPRFFADSTFIFESAWFRRYGYLIREGDLGRRLLRDVIQAARLRRLPKATSGVTLNVVWAHSEPLDDDLLEELLRLGPIVNIRPVLVTPDEVRVPVGLRLGGIYGSEIFS